MTTEYVSLAAAPVIVVDDNGFTHADYSLRYTVSSDEDARVAAASLTLSANGQTMATVPAATEGEGVYTFLSGYRFIPAPNGTPDTTVYAETIAAAPEQGVTLRSQATPVVKTQPIPVATVHVATDQTAPVELRQGADEIRFGNGVRPEKRYQITLSSISFFSDCGSVTGTISAVDAESKPVAKPVDTDGATYYPVLYHLAFSKINGRCTAKFGKTPAEAQASGKTRFIVTNRSEQSLTGSTDADLSGIAPLYGGLGKHTVQIEIRGVKRQFAIEPVGVVILAIDGLRQDVLYAPEGEDDGTGVHASYKDPNGCGEKTSCYVQPKELSGLCEVLGGKYHDGWFSDKCDPADFKNKHIKLPGVTTIFPSITFAAWASIYTGKPPRETGILGNEFFARDLYDPANSWNKVIPGLDTIPSGMVTLDADGGAFRPAPSSAGLSAVLAKFSPSAPFALNYVMPAEFLDHNTLVSKLTTSAPGTALKALPIWQDINSMVSSRYQISTSDRCDQSENECRTVSILNQYAGNMLKDPPSGAWNRSSTDWWGTPGHKGKLLWEAMTGGSLFDSASIIEAVSFINDYFKQTRPDGKKKRFPALLSVYLPGLDHEAHINGMGEYTKFFKDSTDAKIAEIVKALKDNDEFENKIFIIVSDHGETQMPVDRKYRRKEPIVDVEGNPITDIFGKKQYSTYEAPVDMSCSLKTDYEDENVLADERQNNSLHVWELGRMFQQLSVSDGYRLLVPKEIEQSILAGLKQEEYPAVTSEIESANVIAALNGPVAHFYVKSTSGWSISNLDILQIGRLADKLKLYFGENGTSLRQTKKDIINRLLASTDAILIRDEGRYKLFKGLTSDDSGAVTGLVMPGEISELQDAPSYVNAVKRLEGTNHPKRSGDIVVLMKDDPNGSATDRYSTAYACKAWHGSLNKSDSYVPLIIGYPGGNGLEITTSVSAVCQNDKCSNNWVLSNLISQLVETQYSGR